MIQQLQKKLLDVPGPIRGGISSGAYFTDYDVGPFASTEEMEEWFNGRLRVMQWFGPVKIPSFTGKFRQLVIVHGDLHNGNLILDRNGNVWIIYWETASAYPPYFETASLRQCGGGICYHVPRGLLKVMNEQAGGQYKEEIRRLDMIGYALSTEHLLQVTKEDLVEKWGSQAEDL